MKRVVVLGGWSPSLVAFRGPLLAAMASAGHQVTAMAPEDDPEVRGWLNARGVGFEPIPLLERTGLNPARDARAVASLVAALRRLRPDVLLAYTIKPVVYGGLAGRIAKVPNRYALITGLGYAFLGQERLARRALARLARALYRAGLAGCRAVLFQNPDDLADFQRMRVVPRDARLAIVPGSGVDLEAFARQPLPSGPPVFLFVGRLLREKGVFELVEAARLVKRRHPHVRFQLLGWLDPNPAAVSRHDLETWQREGVLEYLGETRDVRPFLAAATALVLPSYREGTPRSVLEAMATGRPAIVTDVPGCREVVVDRETGFLVPPRDPSALAGAIERLIAAPDLVSAMSDRARALAEHKYDVRKVNAAMLAAMELDGP